MPEMQSVNSSLIEAIGYDAEAQELYIRFRSGLTYVYMQVPGSVYDQLTSAESVGRFFHSMVRPAYAHRKETP